MKDGDKGLAVWLNRPQVWDVVAALLLSSLFLLGAGGYAAGGSLYGMSVVWLGRWQQQRQLGRAERIAGKDAGKNLRYLYRCAAERFVTTAALLAIGIVGLKLAPIPLLSGFVVGHVMVAVKYYRESSLRRR